MGHVWTPAKSRVYAVLPRLVDEGLLTRREVAQTHRPDKHLYTLTDEGRAAFERWVREPAWRSHDEFLLKVFFGDALAAEELAALVSRYREQETARLAEYRAIEDRISGSPRDRFRYQTLRWGLAAARARIRWADEALRTLAKETATS